MNKFMKSLVAVTVQLSIVGYPLTAFAANEPQYDQWIINQATINIQAKQAEQARKEWDSYTADQKYNRTYKQYMDKLAEYNKNINILKSMVDDKPQNLVSDDVDVIKNDLSQMYSDISNLSLGEKSGDSRLYLQKSCDALKNVADKVSWYSFYKSTKAGSLAEVEKATNELNSAIKIFTDYFSKCYNYSIITQNNGFDATEVNQANTDLHEFVNGYVEMFQKSYDSLEAAHSSMLKGQVKSDLLKEAKANLGKPGYFNGFTSGQSVVGKISETAEYGEEAYKALEQYSYDVITGDKGSGDKSFKEKFIKFKANLDELKSELSKLKTKNTALQYKVDENVESAKAAERQFLEEKGFASMEEYEKYLEEQQKLVTQKQIADEAAKISAEMKKQEEERKAAVEAAHKRWLDERIDFSKGQAKQNHDKVFYMTKVQKAINRQSLNNTYLGTLLMEEQSEAYDAMWKIANSGNADLNLLQQLYDEYPNDFINIVFFYTIK